jgi:hypothetical protein
MMVDTHAYFGQPGVFPQLQPQTFVPQSLFGVAPGQYAQSLLGQLIAGCLAQQQLAGQLGAAAGLPGRVSPFDSGLQMLAPTAFAPYAAFTGLPGQYAQPIGQTTGGWPGSPQPGAFPTQTLLGSPQFGGYPGLAGIQPGQFGLPIGTIGGWLGRPHTSGFGPQAVFPNLGGQSLGEISAWQPQIASQLLGALGRSFQPYQQVTWPMACAA